MKNKIRICILCMAILMMLLLSACGVFGKAEDVMLFENNQMNYSIIYPFDAGDDVKNAANTCFEMFKQNVENDITYTDDWSAEEAELEILIGNTNRPESQQAMEKLEGNTYSITIINKKVVICAKEEWMIGNAVEKFLRNVPCVTNESGEIVSAVLKGDFNISYTYDGYTRDRWELTAFPVYDGGVLSDTFSTDAVGYKTLMEDAQNYKMISAYKTDAEEFAAYADKLKKEGFTVTATAQTDSVKGYWVEKDADRMYMYYTAGSKEARFILDQNDSASIEEFSYDYVKQEGDNSTFYLYGIVQDSHGVNIGEKYADGTVNTAYKNTGLFMFVKLADNSILLIDGADDPHMSKEAAEHLNEFLHKITGTAKEEKVTIRCWFITHYHGDHYNGMVRFFTNYHEQYEIERMLYAFRSDVPDDIPVFYKKVLYEYYPNIMYHRPHTGETLKLGDVEMDVLFTFEDLFDSKGMVFASEDSNDTSTIMRIRMEDKSFLVMGDASTATENVLLRNYSAEELKSDALQVSHHGWNNLNELYKVVNPTITLYPQSSGGAVEGLNGAAKTIHDNVVAATVGGADNVFFQGDETVGVEVVNGELKVVFREPVVGKAYDGSDGGAQANWSLFDTFE